MQYDIKRLSKNPRRVGLIIGFDFFLNCILTFVCDLVSKPSLYKSTSSRITETQKKNV